MVWKVQLWVQPHAKWRWRWCARRVGPWFYYETIWVEDWDAIPEEVAKVATAGLYHRLLTCCEEYEESDGQFEPVDHV